VAAPRRRGARSGKGGGGEGRLPRTGRPGPGRPLIDIDLTRLKVLATLHCTQEELAHAFETSPSTIERRMRADAKFRAVIEGARAEGRRSLRRQLWGLALKAGSADAPQGALAALLFLCKQSEAQGGLGMSDRGYLEPAPGRGRDASSLASADEEAEEVVRRELEDKLDRISARRAAAPAPAPKRRSVKTPP
jgi:hypothetical protein